MAYHFADFNDQYVFRLGYALWHFLWQGAILAVIAAVVLCVMRATTANRRYVVLLSFLSVMAVCPVATYCLISGTSTQEAPHAVAAASLFGAVEIVEGEHVLSPILPEIQQIPSTGMPAIAVNEPAEDSASTPRSLRPYLIPLVSIWCVGVFVLSLRLIVGWANTFRVRCMGLSDVSVSIQSMCEKLAATMAVRSTVRVCESTLVQVPVVVGWLRPLILLPACLLSGLSEQQLRAILAHELAHVRRHDYAVNFAQILIENLLFYHPAIWWLSNRIRQERENCCDDIAAAVGGGNRVLARALATLAELHVSAPQTLPAATGGSLVNRIRRLAGTEAGSDKLVSGGLGVGIFVGLFFFLAMALLFHSPSGSANDSKPTSSQSNTPVEANTKEPSATPAAEEPTLADEDEASARPEDIPLDVWNLLPEEARRIFGKKELLNRRAAEDQAAHIELSKDWPLRFPANVQENELAGVILDTEGRPVVGALIDCHTAYTGDETTTDERGMFRYKFDTEGRGGIIEVRFSKEGFSPVYRREQPLGVTNLRIVLNNKTYLEGQVTDEAGNPVPNAEVIAGHPYIWNGEFPSFDRETTTLTDERGRSSLFMWPMDPCI